MAHKQKYTKGAIGHMLAHYDRSKDVPDLDTTHSKDNYNLAEIDQPQKQLDFLHQRLSEVRVQNRKDINVMVDWVLTVPKDLPIDEHKAFFKSSYDFLNNRYGKENVISAYVHMDETTPHMHYAFVPITKDKKRDGFKLSAKEVITKNDLISFHSDLKNHLEKELSHEVNVLNEATYEGNKSISELKRSSAVERLQDATRQSEELISSAHRIVQEEINTNRQECYIFLSEAKKEAQHIQDSLIPQKTEYEAYKAFIDESKKASDISMMYPEYAEVRTKGVFKKQEYVTVPKEMWEAKHVSANQISAIVKARTEVEKGIQTLNQTAPMQKIKNLEIHLDKALEKNQKLSKNLDEVNSELDKIWSVFDRRPDILEDVQKVLNQIHKERNNSKSHGHER